MLFMARAFVCSRLFAHVYMRVCASYHAMHALARNKIKYHVSKACEPARAYLSLGEIPEGVFYATNVLNCI